MKAKAQFKEREGEHMKRIASIVFMLAFFAVPAFAAEATGTSEKPMSTLQFSELTQNHGLSGRVLDRKYEEYRSGRVPLATLEPSRMR